MLKVLSALAVLAILVSTSVGVASRHAQAQTGCSVKEQQLIVSAYQQLMVAAMNGDVQQIAQLSQLLDRALTLGCKAQLTAVSRYSGGGGYRGGYSSREPGVYDHGGGTYSVPGGAACGPSGCIPLN